MRLLVTFLVFIGLGIFLVPDHLISDMAEEKSEIILNVYGKPLKACSTQPLTGFYRNGKCETGRDDYGTHIVCAVVDDSFLQYSKSQGNDLITPFPERHFPGLVAGDQWCLCISRWVEAMEQGVAPKIDLHATHQKALDFVSLETLERYNAK